MDGQVSADSGPSTLAVWHYDSPMGAAAGEIRLRVLEVRETLAVVDTLSLLWLPGTPEPRIGRFRARDVAAGRAGASPRAAARSLLLAPAPKDRGRTGSEAALLDDLAQRLVPGTSVLLVLATADALDGLRHVLERGRGRGVLALTHTVPAGEATDALRALLDGVLAAVAGTVPPDGEPPGQPPVPSPRSGPPARLQGGGS
jgi:hypothetical protein